MSLGFGGSHWDGPLGGSSRSGGGLFEDMPVQAIAAQLGRYFYDPCTSNSLANSWVLAQAGAGGTAVMGASGITLSSSANATGPSIRLVANPTGPVEAGLYLGVASLTSRPTAVAIQTRLGHTAGTANSGFFGFAGAPSANHPLTTAGAANTTSFSDMAGWIWTNPSQTPIPVLVDASTVRTLTTVTTPTLPVGAAASAPGALLGVRIETSSTPRDTVRWYVNNRLVLSASPVGAAQFATNMTAYIGAVANTGSAQTFVVRHFVFAETMYNPV